MKKYNYLFLVLISINIISCTSVKLPSKEILNNLEMTNDEGIVIGAISIDKRNYANGVYLYFSKDDETDEKKVDKISIVPPQTFYVHYEPDLFDDYKAVHYFKVKKPKGKYTFYARRVVHHGVQQYTYLTYPINFPFEVESGKMKYIGEINFKKDETFEINDKSERDLNKLKEMFPTITIEK